MSTQSEKAMKATLGDHRMIMEFLEQRNAEGGKERHEDSYHACHERNGYRMKL